MLFHEIYGCYYNCVGKLINYAIESKLDDESLKSIISESAFQESFLTIIPAIKEEKWQVITKDLKTPIKHRTETPLTLLEKQWLKAISLDPKFKLFNVQFDFLDDIDPLFTPDDFIIYDQYADGDPYEDEHYIQIFQTILKAIHLHKKIKVNYTSNKQNQMYITCFPYKLEYSFKDDKFRVLIKGCSWADTLNIANIKECILCGDIQKLDIIDKKKQSITIELYDRRNALERAMLHFAHFQKEATQIDNQTYSIKIDYDENDETELLIRILSFGPNIKVISPDSFISQIKQRLKKQKDCELK